MSVERTVTIRIPEMGLYGCRLCDKLASAPVHRAPRGCGVHPGCMKRYVPLGDLQAAERRAEIAEKALEWIREMPADFPGSSPAEIAADALAEIRALVKRGPE